MNHAWLILLHENRLLYMYVFTLYKIEAHAVIATRLQTNFFLNIIYNITI